jgi:acetyl esterase/lipase
MPAISTVSKPTPSRTAHEFTVDDVEYLSHGGSPLLLRLFKPKGAGPFPLMIDLHGGAWCSQDRTSDAMFNEALARSGAMANNPKAAAGATRAASFWRPTSRRLR